MAGRTIACPACGGEVAVPRLPDEHHLRVTTGRVPIPTHAHGAPRAGETVAPAARQPKPRYSLLAIASVSLSAGSVILGPFGCIPGIIFGYLAKGELRQNPRLQGAELARAGIMVGYCFLGLFTLIGLWLMVHFARAN